MKSEAFIYLSDKRGITQSSTHRSFHTFNFGPYQKSNFKPFQNLAVFNDDTILPASRLIYSVPGDHLVFLLPIVGGIEFQVNEDQSSEFIEAGQSALIAIKKTSLLAVQNPYDSQHVNFICCWISNCPQNSESVIISNFDLSESKNTLIDLFPSAIVKVQIGKFSGRSDYKINVDDNPVAFFTFIIEGAFEFQNMLLHQSDSAGITNTTGIEFEALSDDAVLLTIAL